ncbi:hypothetical protein CROQUDRAFT_673688 [Cronartium quercuum f. sp. fusiforme G11]|uniref:Uncharacterized protein n=1 Tax=Cronartium quercuum f. sp. fusiforme G11 TaxID=708437 RepID=A0A9P6NAV8_9BASI|nr:hypothetical protein CROQUDRAFT_673688 [Cronartium quercuum f. sp. fusiforme G11]
MDPWATNAWEETTNTPSFVPSSTLEHLPSTISSSWPSTELEIEHSTWGTHPSTITHQSSLDSIKPSSSVSRTVVSHLPDSPAWPSAPTSDLVAIPNPAAQSPTFPQHPLAVHEGSLAVSFQPLDHPSTDSNASDASDHDYTYPRSNLQDAPDDDWGGFNPLPLTSNLPIPKIDSPILSTSAAEGWDGTTSLGEWEPPPLLPPPTSLTIESVISDHETSPSGWGATQLEDPPELTDGFEDQTETGDVEDAWADSKPRVTYQVPTETLTKVQVETRRWAQEQYPIQEDKFLPPGKAAMTMDLSAAMEEGGELSVDAEIALDLSKPPLPETSEISTQKLFQNSAVSNAFQLAITQTASSAANVLKSATRPRRLFPMGGLTGLGKAQSSSSEIGHSSAVSGPDSMWDGVSALENPHHPHDNKKDAFGQYDAQHAPQQTNARSSGLFGLWSAAKSAPATNTPATLLTKKPENLLNDGFSSATDAHSSSISSPPPSNGPLEPSYADFQASASPSSATMQEASSSRISRLFGRFGMRSKDSPTSDQSTITSASTELDNRDVAFLDAMKTVPMENDPALYAAFDELQLKGQRSNSIKGSQVRSNDIKASGDGLQPDMLDLLGQSSSMQKLASPLTVQKPLQNANVSSASEPDPFEVFNKAPISKPPQPTGGNHRQSLANAPYPASSSSSSSKPISHYKSASNGISNGSRYDTFDDLFSDFNAAPPPPRPSPCLAFSPPAPAPLPTRLPTTHTRTPTVQLTNATNSSVPIPILRPPPSAPAPVVPLIAPPLSRPASTTIPLSSSFAVPKPMISSPLSASPASRPVQVQGQGGGGLSKQDLSFFDSLL